MLCDDLTRHYMAGTEQNDDHDDDNDDNDNRGQRFPCSNCRMELLLPKERCPRCGNIGRAINQIVNERMMIRDRQVRVLSTLERNHYYLLGSLAVTVGIPILFLIINLNLVFSTIFGIIGGLVAFILGIYGVTLVKRINEGGG
jgi:hypothetical protein